MENSLACPTCGAPYVYDRRSPRDPARRHWPARCDACRARIYSLPDISVVPVPAGLAELAKPRFQFINQCFIRAGEFALGVPDAFRGRVEVIHGTYFNGQTGHAWIEIDAETSTVGGSGSRAARAASPALDEDNRFG